MNHRMKPEHRREDILKHAVKVASKSNYNHITRRAVAKAAGCAPSLISAYFGTMYDFRFDIIKAAIAVENLTVISQLLVSADPAVSEYVDSIPVELRQKALETLVIQ